MGLSITPAVVDAIVGAVAVEFAALGLWLAHAGARRLVAPLFLHLASGAFLLLALRASLAAAGPHWIALALGAALVAHAASLWQSQRTLWLERAAAGDARAASRVAGS